MKKEKDNVLPKMVRKVVKAARGSDHDPLGSYTGTPANDEDGRPTQDADDLWTKKRGGHGRGLPFSSFSAPPGGGTCRACRIPGR